MAANAEINIKNRIDVLCAIIGSSLRSPCHDAYDVMEFRQERDRLAKLLAETKNGQTKTPRQTEFGRKEDK